MGGDDDGSELSSVVFDRDCDDSFGSGDWGKESQWDCAVGRAKRNLEHHQRIVMGRSFLDLSKN